MDKEQKQINYWAHMLDEAFDKDVFINEKNTFDNVKLLKKCDGDNDRKIMPQTGGDR